MVRYVLSCHSDHKIEAWFRDEDQRKIYQSAKDECCPACEIAARGTTMRAEPRFQADAPRSERIVRH
jgi:hypothetical protein